MIATWTRSGQTDRPSENSFKASPTSNGDRDKPLCRSTGRLFPAKQPYHYPVVVKMTF